VNATEWLESTRAEHAAEKNALERYVHVIRDGSEPDQPHFRNFDMLPFELMRPGNNID
jgi:hypothetical protein